MNQEQSCSYLPPEILLSILSRIPIKAVLTCKCVCKSWLDLLESPEFARSHLSKSAHWLLINHSSYGTNKKNTIKIFEFEDSLEVERHEHRYRTLLEFDISKIFDLNDDLGTRVRGSVNGLLFLGNRSGGYYVCSPFTRQYIKLPVPEGIVPAIIPYGFGVSRLTSQYKVVRILPYRVFNANTGSLLSIQNPVWQVYTLGTKSWRSIATPSGMLLDYYFSDIGILLNGNLHWLAKDSTGSHWITCFDLENEAFTKFRAPKVEPLPRGQRRFAFAIGVLRDRLCLFDNSSKSEISIYMMNDYGERSWSKEYVISNSAVKTVVYAVKAFADGGDLLMLSSECYPVIHYYSNRKKTIELVDGTLNADSIDADVKAMLYTPSFISLKEYETENVKVFEFFSLL